MFTEKDLRVYYYPCEKGPENQKQLSSSSSVAVSVVFILNYYYY